MRYGTAERLALPPYLANALMLGKFLLVSLGQELVFLLQSASSFIWTHVEDIV
jgi:hypothetical protein